KPPTPFARPHAPHQLIRLIDGIEGDILLNVNFQPRPNYGRGKPGLHAFAQGLVVDLDGEPLCHLYSTARLSVSGANAEATVPVRKGERLAFVLELQTPDKQIAATELFGALQQLELTVEFWNGWSQGCRY